MCLTKVHNYIKHLSLQGANLVRRTTGETLNGALEEEVWKKTLAPRRVLCISDVKTVKRLTQDRAWSFWGRNLGD